MYTFEPPRGMDPDRSRFIPQMEYGVSDLDSTMENEMTFDVLRYFLETGSRLEIDKLLTEAAEIRLRHVGKEVYLRGLIELSNACHKNCYYCGIRAGNSILNRFSLEDEIVVDAARKAHDLGFGSVVMQSGEIISDAFIHRISVLLKKIHRATNHELGITLSLGEQSLDTYKRWHDDGAQRYLLRIETSTEELYKKLHPDDDKHSFGRRVEALLDLKKVGYQVGSGVMIGLPFQSEADLARDLLFFKEMDMDMFGMGPFIPHPNTPFWKLRKMIPSAEKRVDLTLRMIALIRLLMKDVNIASTTALETLDKDGRMKGLLSGANVFMPNMTPVSFARNYALYENKPVIEDYLRKIDDLENKIAPFGLLISRGKRGDPRHFSVRKSTKENAQ